LVRLIDSALALLGVLLPLAILLRGTRTGSIRSYPWMFGFIAFIAGCNFCAAIAFRIGLASAIYYKTYWTVAFAETIAEGALLLDVLGHAQFSHSSTGGICRLLKFAVIAVLLVLGGVACVRGIPHGAQRPIWFLRDIYTASAALVIVVLGAAIYFGVRFGWNRRGIILGLCLDTGVGLITASLLSFSGRPLKSDVGYAIPFASVTACLIWLLALWHQRPDPVSDPAALTGTPRKNRRSRTRYLRVLLASPFKDPVAES
jgi:hypothetical protein